jgi:metal-sulfur cluster biosynthetic enzyme
MQLESMYQDIILDHYKNPHGRGLREPFEAEVHHVNPTCGDEVTLRLHLDGDTIADVSYEGMGCSIVRPSLGRPRVTENQTTEETPAELPPYKSALLEDLEEAMRDVVDPELGVNVVDLGLVYGIDVDDSNVAILDMTLTSAACPLTDVIEDQARQALTGGPGPGLVDDIRINWVWMPPWGPDKITDDGREQLRALGFRV